ncbi:hypothetical protein ACLMJK_008781 [Lecanora helva]
MWSSLKLLLLAYLARPVIGACSPTSPSSGTCPIADLKSTLSKDASITYNRSSDPRWSDFNPPLPGAIINVATESDVVATVRFCKANNIPYLAQNGGTGWISTFHLGSNGVVINLRGLNQISFNPARTQATIGGGIIISEAIQAAYANNAQLTTGNCNCVGVLGAILGGGYGNLMGLNGFGVDTLLSVNLVNSDGKLITVNSSNADLWWALRGAGPNFGIVTSAVILSSYVAQVDNKAWLGSLIYTEDKLETVVAAIESLRLEPRMNVFLYFVVSDSRPVVLVTPFYYGSEATARQKFATLLNIGPTMDTTAVVAYNHWNDGAEGFCIKGERKPAFAAGFMHMIPAAWRAVWNEFVAFTSHPGTASTIILMEAYSLGKGQSVPDDSSAFPHRHIRFNAAALPWYPDKSLDPVADAFKDRVRNIWWTNDNLTTNASYINFASGDEELDVVYGSSLQRLQTLKKRYDPRNVFNQWFPLSPVSRTAIL